VQGEANFTKPMLGVVQPVKVRYRGAETLRVPAGEFQTHRFLLDGEVDIWITLPDRLLVRSAWPRYRSEYVLSRLAESPDGAVLLR
jgi:hypothetical protein